MRLESVVAIGGYFVRLRRYIIHHRIRASVIVWEYISWRYHIFSGGIHHLVGSILTSHHHVIGFAALHFFASRIVEEGALWITRRSFAVVSAAQYCLGRLRWDGRLVLLKIQELKDAYCDTTLLTSILVLGGGWRAIRLINIVVLALAGGEHVARHASVQVLLHGVVLGFRLTTDLGFVVDWNGTDGRIATTAKNRSGALPPTRQIACHIETR